MVSAVLSQGTVHPDTQAVLLLCGSFSRGSEETPSLTLREYNALASWLVRHGRRPADLLRTPNQVLPEDGTPGLPETERLRTLLSRGVQMAVALERWQSLGLWVISRGEESYPERLRRTLRSGAPPLLYGAGAVDRLGLGGLAVVGSRTIDEEGLSFTRRVAARCAGAGVQIVSGGARGVDQAAVAAALTAGGGAVAVLAERLDRAATSREAKEPLRRGLLTLVTPYEPEVAFSVGRAMGRNKHVYALADCALIVRFTRGEGGTWAGAIEQLARNRSSAPVPVFVRIENNEEEGNRDLQSRGALPFPEETFWEGKVLESLGLVTALPERREIPPADAAPTPSKAEGSTTSPAEALAETATAGPLLPSVPQLPAPASSTSSGGDTCYNRCLPLLLQQFREEPGEKDLAEIAKRLELTPRQFNEWLKRALKEGKVTKKKKGKRFVYLDTSISEDKNFFGRGGDAA